MSFELIQLKFNDISELLLISLDLDLECLSSHTLKAHTVSSQLVSCHCTQAKHNQQRERYDREETRFKKTITDGL